jgi:hypothetical protein
MSDGPHRSLPMRPGWKKVAEYADNEAFARDEVRDAVVSAVEKDWRKDISGALITSIRDVLGGTTLFSEDTLRSIEDLRQTVSGCAMGNALLDHLACAVGGGMTGDAALREAVVNTSVDQSARCARQVEEHYLRKSTIETSQDVRQRIEEAIKSAGFDSVADRIVEPASRHLPNVKKKDGVDDGVQL